MYASTVQDQGYSNNGYYVGILNETVNFSVGQSTAQVSVTINDLGLTSSSETFRFIVQQSPSQPVTTCLATDNFTINNNDVATTYSISPNPASVNENAGHLIFTVTRSSSFSAATVYASTVQDQGYSNNGYYVGVSNQVVNFSAGQSTAQVSVTINDLGLTSGSETFRFIVQQNSTDPVSTYLATDNFTINYNDAATTYSISPNPASVNENAGRLIFTITRSSSLSAATVYASTVQDQGYSNNGYYVGVSNQVVNFSASQSTAQVSVTINDLGLTSGSETFRFIVQQNPTDPVSTYLATDTFTINNNDAAITYSISPNPASVNENAGHLIFTVTRSSSLSAATVYASTVQDQGYSNNGYYVGVSNQVVNFSAGQSTAQLSVTINDFGLTSGSETFRFIVQQNPTDPVSTYLATDNFTILNNDSLTTLTVNSPNSSTTWTAGTSQTVIWTVSGTPASPISYYAIDYSLNGGSTWTYNVTYAYPPATSVAWLIPSTVASTQARVQVRAVNSAGSSMFWNYSAHFTISSSAGNPFSAPTCSNLSPSPASAVTINFTGTNSTGSSASCGIVSYQWTFGDGGTSTAANPSHTYYPTAGTATHYSVNLTVTDCGGKQASANLPITITGLALGNNNPTQPTSKDPVNLATGNYTYNHVDLRFPVAACPLNSSAITIPRPPPARGCRSAYGWTDSYNIQLSVNASNSAVVIAFGDGHSGNVCHQRRGRLPQRAGHLQCPHRQRRHIHPDHERAAEIQFQFAGQPHLHRGQKQQHRHAGLHWK